MYNPSDPLFPYSFGKQVQIQAIQDDINEIIAQVQWGFFEEVQGASAESLTKFENLANRINELHAPIYEDFSQLPPSSCRDGAETLINTTRIQTGFHAGNCASRLDNAVSSILADTNQLFENFNSQFSEIQQIVVKSFVQSNLFVDLPTDVMGKMDDNHVMVEARWDALRPDFVELRNKLKGELSSENSILQNCQQESVNLATTLYGMTRGQIDVCIEYSQNVNQRARAAPVSSRNFIEEAVNFLANHKFEYPYQA